MKFLCEMLIQIHNLQFDDIMWCCDSIYEAKVSRQGFEKRVVSQDLQLWLSNVSFHNPYKQFGNGSFFLIISEIFHHLIAGTSHESNVYSPCSGWKTGNLEDIIKLSKQ